MHSDKNKTKNDFSMLSTVRKYHKWLMAFIGLQFIFWSATGLYMVSIDIHRIHGEHLVHPVTAKIELSEVEYPITALFEQYPGATDVSLEWLLNRPVYQFKSTSDEGQWRLVDAKSGKTLPTISETDAVTIAKQQYALGHKLHSAVFLDNNAPPELSPRHLPVWQVEFEHFSRPTLYISALTGQVVTKRHSYWRIFDWMWRFHIMDYDDGENVGNWLLTLLAISGLIAALAGAVLTYFRIVKPDTLEAK